MPTPFVKMHGLGNDFIVIDDFTRASDTRLNSETGMKLCDRRHGIGADQILWLRKPHDSKSADLRMEIINNDGSIAEMCGNGIRAVALYLNQITPKSSYRIETLAGIKIVEIRGDQVDVDMGEPQLKAGFANAAGEHLTALGKTYSFFEVGMGNPHAIIFVDDVLKFPAGDVGPAIEHLPRFPKRTNVEFVQILGPKLIRTRVWERGAGLTLACGTGACAAAAAAIALGKVTMPLEVALPGGSLIIRWEGQGKSLFMKGPATEVFRGEIEI